MSTIGSNRIIQKYHSASRLGKIQASDPNRLEALWFYFSQSYTFSAPNEGMTIDLLMNNYHFDVYQFESLRMQNESVQFTHKGISITLKSKNEITPSLHGYTPIQLAKELPERPFPLWTSSTFTDADFKLYKEKVWEWAKDFPELYLAYTADTQIIHIRFEELTNLIPTRRNNLIQSGNYIIID